MPDVFIQRTGAQAQGLLLGQSRPTDTAAVSLYSPADGVHAVVKRVIICNTTASNALARLFHDEDGTTYDESTALYWDHTVHPGNPANLEIGAFMTNSGGNLAVRTDITAALTFTAYGEETQVRAR